MHADPAIAKANNSSTSSIPIKSGFRMTIYSLSNVPDDLPLAAARVECKAGQ